MITATVLTKNSERTLRNCLESLQDFDEVIVLDSGSTDNSLKIAGSFSNVSIHTSPFLGFGPLHNYAAKLASNDWIFSIDSDEVATPELILEVKKLKLNPNKVFTIPRHNFFNGKQIRGCSGWYPDRVIRFYNRKSTSFSDDTVHEKVLANDLKIAKLHSPLNHTPYLEIDDFLDKMQHYSSLFAEQASKEEATLIRAIGKGWFAFFKSYIIKGGLFFGREGYIISLYNAHTTYYKYLKLLTIQREYKQ